MSRRAAAAVVAVLGLGCHVAALRTLTMKQSAPPLRSTPPLKVALAVEPTPFTHVCGYANRFQTMLTYLAKAGDNVAVVTPDDCANPPKSFKGFRIHTIPGFRFPLYNEICLSLDLVHRRVSKTIRSLKPDIVHTTSPGFLALTTVLLSRVFRVPCIVSYHTHLPAYTRDYLGFLPYIDSLAELLLRVCHNIADMTLVTSPQMLDALKAFGVKRLSLWRKGIDTDTFNPRFNSREMRERLTEGNPDDPLILYVGRLGAEKKLKQIRTVLDRNPNVRLALVGEGPYREEYMRHFKGTKTVFTGLMRGEPLSQAFASADVFCMPSDSETLGFVVLEAMASGTPVVGSDAGGIPNLIDHGRTGFLVAPGDADGFEKRVSELIRDVEKRKAMAAEARAEAEKWDWESATSVLRNVQYRRAIRVFNIRQARATQWLRRVLHALGLGNAVPLALMRLSRRRQLQQPGPVAAPLPVPAM